MRVLHRTFQVQKGLLREDAGTCWVFYIGVELYQRLMQLTEGFIFLAYMPVFTVKLNVHNILCILAVVMLIHVYSCLLNRDIQG